MFCTVFTSQHCLSGNITWTPTGNANTTLPSPECSLWLLPLTSSSDRSVFKFKNPFHISSLCFHSTPTTCPSPTLFQMRGVWKIYGDHQSVLMNYSKCMLWSYHSRVINLTTIYRWRICLVAQCLQGNTWNLHRCWEKNKSCHSLLHCREFQWLNMWHTYGKIYVTSYIPACWSHIYMWMKRKAVCFVVKINSI